MSRMHARRLSLSLLAASLALAACASTVPNRDPVGELLPRVSGESLDGEDVAFPDDLEDAPAVLLVGYEMDAQFDLDRWILGLLQAGTPVRVVELPAIDGMLPGLFAGRIDAGMRSGIPREDWPSVVTLYGADAERMVALTGAETPRNGRVLLVDGTGTIRWFHDRGYSAGKLQELDEHARELAGE